MGRDLGRRGESGSVALNILPPFIPPEDWGEIRSRGVPSLRSGQALQAAAAFRMTTTVFLWLRLKVVGLLGKILHFVQDDKRLDVVECAWYSLGALVGPFASLRDDNGLGFLVVTNTGGTPAAPTGQTKTFAP